MIVYFLLYLKAKKRIKTKQNPSQKTHMVNDTLFVYKIHRTIHPRTHTSVEYFEFIDIISSIRPCFIC